jgi:hypothetical protein
LVHHCCEHQPDASQLNEQRAPLATAPFWRAQAPGGSLTLLAEAAERLIAATALANKTIFTIEFRIFSPLSQIDRPARARHAVIFYIAMPGTLATSPGRIRFAKQIVLASRRRSACPKHRLEPRLVPSLGSSSAGLFVFAPDAERFLRRTIGDREQHRLLR